MLKIIVFESQGFNDYELLKKEMTGFLFGRRPCQVEIVCKRSNNLRSYGEIFANDTNCNWRVFLTKQDKYGEYASSIRNIEMVNYADACVVFWDGEDENARHLIELADKNDLLLKVVKY